MRRRSSPTLVDLLRSTLVRLERSPGIDPEDEVVHNLERSVLRTLAEVQRRRSERSEDKAA